MSPEKELLQAIAELTSEQKSQLIMYLFAGDSHFAALETIDSSRWKLQQYVRTTVPAAGGS